MFDDIEQMRAVEEDKEKNESSKLSFAGMMALVAGLGLVAFAAFSGALVAMLPALASFIGTALPIIGFGALGYGFYKTIKLAFRQKMLTFPSLNVYRKKNPAAKSAGTGNTATGTRTRSRGATDTGARRSTSGTREFGRPRPRTARVASQRTKNLRRSRRNRVFSGVSGGIAEYTGVSSALVRFAWLAGLFMSGGMIIFAYLLLSIILPGSYGDDDIY